jgi:hypothetical protein
MVKKGIVNTSDLEEDPRITEDTHTVGSQKGKLSAAAKYANEKSIYSDDDDDDD